MSRDAADAGDGAAPADGTGDHGALRHGALRHGVLRHGVLREPPATWWRLQRFDPPADLAAVVSHTWVASRRLPPGRRHRQGVLPYPAANLVVEDGEVLLYGPQSQRVDRELTGSGRVVGVRFRPGVTGLVARRPADHLTDRSVPVEGIGLDGPSVRAFVEARDDDAAAATALIEAVRPALPTTLGADVAELRDLVEAIVTDRTLTRTAELAARIHVTPRTLQRRFAAHVGLSPAWVLRRYRIQDALARAGASDDPDWAAVARTVGYYDQAHLIRDITETVGRSPAAYLRELADDG